MSNVVVAVEEELVIATYATSSGWLKNRELEV